MRTKTATLLFAVLATGCASSSFTSSSGRDPGVAKRPSAATPPANTPQSGTPSEGNKPVKPGSKPSSPATKPDLDATAKDGAEGADVFVPDAPVTVPRFALLLNDLRCAMCHVTVNGDIVSTAAKVGDWSGMHARTSDERVAGRWLAAGTWTDVADDGTSFNITVRDGVSQNYTGPEMPNGFPSLDLKAARDRAQGRISGKTWDGQKVVVEKYVKGNVILTGDAAAPIQIESSVVIDGDLVIYGTYSGIGSIYVTGRIYLPSSLRAKASVFPFSTAASAALERGKELVAAKEGDALGLASAHSIFIASTDSRIFDGPMVPENMQRAALGVDGVTSWLGDYSSLVDSQNDVVIDAYLYAASAVAGFTRATWTVNGGIIADTMHILGVGAAQSETARNSINYDYRMQAGLRILGELSTAFE